MRAALGDAAGLGVVAGGDDEETADDLLALGIRSVGRGQPAALGAQDPAGVIGELVARLELAPFAQAIRPLHVFPRHARELLTVRGGLTGPVRRTLRQHQVTRHW